MPHPKDEEKKTNKGNPKTIREKKNQKNKR
jgi:hypothetical protein